MSRSLDIVRRARKDVNRIYDWLERRSPRGAMSWYRAFWAEATRITAHPEVYAIVEEADRLHLDIRLSLFKTRKGRRYRIIFEFTESSVRILRVLWPGQRPLRRRDLPSN